MLLRTYTRVVAVVLVLATVVEWFGVSMVGSAGLVFYLGTAILFAYAGFRRADPGFTRAVVGGLGAFYLVSGLVLAALFVAFEFPFEGRLYAEALGLATLGGVSVLCARVLPCEDDPPDGSPGGSS